MPGSLGHGCTHPRPDPAGAQGAAARPPRRRPPPVDGDRAGRETRLHRPADHRRRRAGASGSRRAPTAATSTSTSRRSSTRSASCRPRTRSSGWRPSAPRTWRPTASSTPRCASPPSCTSTAASRSTRSSRRCSSGFRLGSAGHDHHHRHAASPPCATPPTPSEIAELAAAPPRRRRRRLRHRGQRGRLPADPPPRRVPDDRQDNFHITIHAGEAFGLPSIWEAVQLCGAERLGHGVRIVDDITFDDDGRAQLGRLAASSATAGCRWRCAPRRTSTPARAPSIAEHPIGLLPRLRFRVTVNTDNRLMSDIDDDRGVRQPRRGVRLRLGRDRVAHDQRHEERRSGRSTSACSIINGRIKPGFAALRAEDL